MPLIPGVPWSQTCWANHTVEFRGEQGSPFQRKGVLQGPGPKIWLYTSQIWNWRSNEKYKSDAEFCFKILILKVCSLLLHLPWSTLKSRLFLPLSNKMTLGLRDSQKLVFFSFTEVLQSTGYKKTGSSQPARIQISTPQAVHDSTIQFPKYRSQRCPIRELLWEFYEIKLVKHLFQSLTQKRHLINVCSYSHSGLPSWLSW